MRIDLTRQVRQPDRYGFKKTSINPPIRRVYRDEAGWGKPEISRVCSGSDRTTKARLTDVGQAAVEEEVDQPVSPNRLTPVDDTLKPIESKRRFTLDRSSSLTPEVEVAPLLTPSPSLSPVPSSPERSLDWIRDPAGAKTEKEAVVNPQDIAITDPVLLVLPHEEEIQQIKAREVEEAQSNKITRDKLDENSTCATAIAAQAEVTKQQITEEPLSSTMPSAEKIDVDIKASGAEKANAGDATLSAEAIESDKLTEDFGATGTDLAISIELTNVAGILAREEQPSERIIAFDKSRMVLADLFEKSVPSSSARPPLAEIPINTSPSANNPLKVKKLIHPSPTKQALTRRGGNNVRFTIPALPTLPNSGSRQTIPRLPTPFNLFNTPHKPTYKRKEPLSPPARPIAPIRRHMRRANTATTLLHFALTNAQLKDQGPALLLRPRPKITVVSPPSKEEKKRLKTRIIKSHKSGRH